MAIDIIKLLIERHNVLQYRVLSPQILKDDSSNAGLILIRLILPDPTDMCVD